MSAACAWHITQSLSGSIQYIAYHEDADRRHKAGQRQIQCRDCNLWIWPDLFGKRPNERCEACGQTMPPSPLRKQCASCGEWMKIGAGQRTKRATYCGEACRQRAQRQRNKSR